MRKCDQHNTLTRTLAPLALAMILGNLSLWAQNSLEVVAAYYGVNERFADVTNQVRSIAQQSGGNGLTVTVTTYAMGLDPAPGAAKVLRVYYKVNDVFAQGEWRDGETARIGSGRITRESPRDRGRGGIPGTVMSTSPLRVTRAVYGAGPRTIDVASRLQSQVVNNRLEVQVSNASMGGQDPAPAVLKELLLSYEYQGRPYELRVKEGEWVRIPDGVATTATPAAATGLRIVSAKYGEGSRVLDVTSQVASRVAGDRVTLVVDNATMGGDPARGADKQLWVVYELNGQRFEARANEGKRLELPDANAVAAAARAGEPILSKPAVVSSTASAGSIADGICFYASRDYQGSPFCVPVGQSVPRISPASFGANFGSVRFFGRARQMDVFEFESYQGRMVQVKGDQADLSQLSGGTFFGTNDWVVSPRSVRVN